MLKVGITGGIGAGKSVVCRIFEALRVPVYDADTRAKHLLAHLEPLKAQVKALFGPEAYLPDGSPNRAYLAAHVFADEAKLQALNALVHPRVADDTRQWLAEQAARHVPYVLKEAALLVETGSYRELDKLIVVTAPEAVRLRRVLARDTHRNEAQVRAIMAKQMPEAAKTALAHYVVVNDGDQALIPQVLALHKALLAEAAKSI